VGAVSALLAPFPYFGGKRTVAADVWERLGHTAQYIEPFCGSAAMLLAKPRPSSLEVICDGSGFIANFWRAVKHQPNNVARRADYPVSHVDLGSRHRWLIKQRNKLAEGLADPDWPGDAKVAGWWLWGQCCWIGSGWCERDDISDDAGQIPHASDAGRGVQAIGKVPHASDAEYLTSSGRTAEQWLRQLADRLERVRVVHGDWSRCLNSHFGGDDTAIFLDPPYRAYEAVYAHSTPVADAVADWARDNAHLRIALCGQRGDYDLPGWDIVEWSRGRLTYSGNKTTDLECVWYSPACLPPIQQGLFDRPYDASVDLHDSYYAAVAELRRRHLAGEAA
jgi:hypothetical protein